MSIEFNYKFPENRHVSGIIWSPIYPPFYPVFHLDNLTNQCFKWEFLKTIKGSPEKWDRTFINPFTTPPQEFNDYWKYKKEYHSLLTESLRILSRNLNNNSLWAHLYASNPNYFLSELLPPNTVPEPIQKQVVNQILKYLKRQNLKQKNLDYWINNQIIFNNMQMDPPGAPHIMLSSSTKPTLPTFTWFGAFAGIGTIPLIDFTQKKLKSICYFEADFLDPVLNWNNIPLWLENLIIIPELQKIWIAKEMLTQMTQDSRFQESIYDNSGVELLNFDHILLKLSDIQNFEIEVDFIDQTIPISQYRNIDFRKLTGQGLIAQSQLLSNAPAFILNYNTCLFEKKKKNCPMHQHCGYNDKRIRSQRPRDLSEQNVYKFLRLLRDEKVLSSIKLHALSNTIPDLPNELQQNIKFWIGKLYYINKDMMFHDETPITWKSEPRSDNYPVILLHPWLFETIYSVFFDSIDEITNDWILKASPIDMYLDSPINKANSINKGISCIIGDFDFTSNPYLQDLQKRALSSIINFQRFDQSGKELTDDEVLNKRLGNKGKRMGEAIFGDKARFI